MVQASVKFGQARGVMEKVISDPNFSLIQLPVVPPSKSREAMNSSTPTDRVAFGT